MVNPVKVNGMGQVMGILQGNQHPVALLHPDGRRRRAQDVPGHIGLEIFRGHTEGLGGEHP